MSNTLSVWCARRSRHPWGGWRGAGRTEHYTAADGSSSADRAALQDKRNNVETEQTQFNTIKRQVRQVQQKQWLKIVNVEMMCRLFHLGVPGTPGSLYSRLVVPKT